MNISKRTKRFKAMPYYIARVVQGPQTANSSPGTTNLKDYQGHELKAGEWFIKVKDYRPLVNETEAMFTPGEGDVTNCTFDIFWNVKVKVTDLNTSSGIIRVDNCKDLVLLSVRQPVVVVF